MFKRAWDKAFTKKNIQLSFRKSGIWPTDSIHITKSISVPTITFLPKPPGVLKTLKSAKSIYRFKISYESSLSADKIKTLFSTTVKLSPEISILQYQKRSLEKAIKLQKKKNRQGIRLNLCGEPNKGKVNCGLEMLRHSLYSPLLEETNIYSILPHQSSISLMPGPALEFGPKLIACSCTGANRRL